ncbi:histidinol-phosphatase [Sorangium cellulosum]|uniref:Histidinol-phosphatase n=1 Tax=Sorangium cellulosum TaxID=56 RepID=A0A150QSP0_SORCE|nr:histidinol-phosphatase [Sorangium cellulosum]KYF71001.1 histidinol phosphate phosphatase [Sorangium cellulosum]
MTPSQELVDLAQRLADASGAVIRRYFRKGIEADDKEDASPVTVADREAEVAMRELLAARAPGHGIVGEELGRENEGAELVWVLDPIDGTKAFITGKPLFGTLIALLHRGRPVLGVIDQPVLGERWLGVLGRETLWNGAPARVRACAGLSDVRLSTTGPQYFSPAAARAFGAVAARAKLVSYGGDCYQYGLVASGCVDVVVEHGLKLHDFAALVPVITGAGGLMTDWEGRPLDAASAGDVVAAGDPRAHAEVLAALRAGRPERGDG